MSRTGHGYAPAVLILLLSTAQASSDVNWDLCVAATHADLPALDAALAAGADPNAVGSVRLDEPVSAGGMFFRFLASVATGGFLVPFFVWNDKPEYGEYNGLACALGAEHPSEPVFRRLLAAGARPDVPEPAAALSAYLARHASDADAAAWYDRLVAAGATVAGSPALRSVLVADRPATAALPPLTRRLVADGAAPVPCEAARVGDTAILALGTEPVDAVRCLRGEDPQRLLNVAAHQGHVETVGWLLDHGADVNLALPAESTGRTGFFQRKSTATSPPLVDALVADRADVVDLLLARGADPFAEDSGGRPVVYELGWRAGYTGELLDHASRPEALAWAIERARRPVDPADPDPLRDATRAWLPPGLLPLLDDPDRGPLIEGLGASFWADALQTATLDEVVAELRTPPGARAGELTHVAMACLPQPGERRGEVHRRFRGPVQHEHRGSYGYLLRPLPEGVPPRSATPAAISAWYDHGVIQGYTIRDPAPLRALGCDPGPLVLFDLPAWRVAWEFGPSRAASYGLPANGAFEEIGWDGTEIEVALY